MPDSPGIKLGVFVGGLVVALIGGFGLGKIVSPAGSSGNSPVVMPSMDMGSPGHVHGPAASAGSDVGGISLSSMGYTFKPISASVGKPGRQELKFAIAGPDGKPATQFATVHEKLMHLVVTRHDLTGYQHVHPQLGQDGTWSVPIDLSSPGLWRAVADFTVVNQAGTQIPLTLAYDFTAQGDYQPLPLPPAARESQVDGFTVTYEGTPTVGSTQPLLFRVFQNGSPAANLEPYLGSFGHLVTLRQGDMGYVHVHPEPALVSGGVKFWLSAPSPGSYRMFFDFQVSGQVHTAQFTLEAK